MKIALVMSWTLLAAIITVGCESDDGPTNGGTQEPECGAPENMVEYRVTFTATWSEETHPDDFPPSPHFSRIVGGTHNSDVAFWDVGGMATAGIESMAERGSTDALQAEVSGAIGSGTAGGVLVDGGINPSPGNVVYEFQIQRDFPLVTLVSMIAPSPDWFVGVSGLCLCDGDGWVDSVTVQLFPYDAGTDSGDTYRAGDNDTDPAEAISLIEGAPFLVDQQVPSLGTFSFRRK